MEENIARKRRRIGVEHDFNMHSDGGFRRDLPEAFIDSMRFPHVAQNGF